ncbi:hypothetical protein DQ182_01750 [Enterococcus faecium]|nr:hypothetical protein [Enterococcus faecium]EGP5414769.1 hypothetical protein [Enterococcus faecium]EGP5710796.1 hypothetical protein [Enterococcus faecium]PQC06125.1 hypothetical protein CUM88_05390 [Enterococcus faecium]PQC49035.1 hypothetical protein CUM92_02365 [Enterococcus faecium]
MSEEATSRTPCIRGYNRDVEAIRIRRCDMIFVTPSFLYIKIQSKYIKNKIIETFSVPCTSY